jgi:hypothetical protein
MSRNLVNTYLSKLKSGQYADFKQAYNTVVKLHLATGTVAGAYVCYSNYSNMRKTFPTHLSKDTQKDVRMMMNTAIISKSLYYILLWPVLLTKMGSKNINSIIYPCHRAQITIIDIIGDKKYSYTKSEYNPHFNLKITNNDGNEKNLIRIVY